ncbi:hypothetical protein ACH470_03195 [Streptomyces bottropensis]|uniref:hypothetical protein n=1 Tax=Streptomyces bottropensis TaxID=42235 RepID=UPI0037884AE7
MPFTRRRRNQEPEPVHPGSQPLARGTTGVPVPCPIGDPLPIVSAALGDAKADAARWKRHADTYDTERAEATQLCDQYRDELKRVERERAQLLAWLAALHPSTAAIAPAHDPDGSQDLYIVAGSWQLCWPISVRDADLFRHVPVVDVTDVRAQWDGHGSVQRAERLRDHVRLLALDGLSADGPLTAVTPVPPGA